MVVLRFFLILIRSEGLSVAGSDQKIKKDREKIKIGAKNLSAPDQKSLKSRRQNKIQALILRK